jgi:hypothetical protein
VVFRSGCRNVFEANDLTAARACGGVHEPSAAAAAPFAAREALAICRQ